MRRGHTEIRIVKGRTVRVKKIVHLQPRSLRDRLPDMYPQYSALRVAWSVELLGFDNWFLFFEDPGYGDMPSDYREVDHFDALFEEAASLLVDLPETQKEQS